MVNFEIEMNSQPSGGFRICQTYPAIINACLAMMAVDIAEFTIVRSLLRRLRHGLRNELISLVRRRFFTLLDGDPICCTRRFAGGGGRVGCRGCGGLV